MLHSVQIVDTCLFIQTKIYTLIYRILSKYKIMILIFLRLSGIVLSRGIRIFIPNIYILPDVVGQTMRFRLFSGEAKKSL